jgi:hypothetical protein
MLKQTAVKFFKTHTAVAEALHISRAAVSKWPHVVPEGSAYKLQFITGGQLRVNERLYSKTGRSARA